MQGAPDLLVEVLSEWTARIDRTAKLKLYAKYVVAEYWVLDTDPVSAHVHRGGTSGLELCEHLGPEGVFTTPMLPASAAVAEAGGVTDLPFPVLSLESVRSLPSPRRATDSHSGREAVHLLTL